MEKSKKLCICLLCALIAAIVVGVLYYYYEVRGSGEMNEGTLISNVEIGLRKLCR